MHVQLMAAVTVDGKIARTPDHYPDWTGKADKRLYADITRKAGVMIMGSKTFDAIGRALPDRKTIVMTRNPNRRTPHPDLVFTADPPDKILGDLSSVGIQSVVLAGGATINTLFAEKGLIDEMILTISPLAFGAGISLFSHAVDIELALKHMDPIDANTVCLRYEVIRP
ncbi:dihydrofolate reductase family protein [Desulfosarcina sp. OttesenSCG-928-A07]|nr:dihydrofolate reductase family protein [Desulfosarcina sp. OttesenSCG-928-A07]